jgi:hypothetical protein
VIQENKSVNNHVTLIKAQQENEQLLLRRVEVAEETSARLCPLALLLGALFLDSSSSRITKTLKREKR